MALSGSCQKLFTRGLLTPDVDTCVQRSQLHMWKIKVPSSECIHIFMDSVYFIAAHHDKHFVTCNSVTDCFVVFIIDESSYWFNAGF